MFPPAFLWGEEHEPSYRMCAEFQRRPQSGDRSGAYGSVSSVPEVWLLDHTMDVDHHRSVLTFAGSLEAVGEAALRVIRPPRS